MNKVILIGNLGKDPEKRTTTSGKDVATLNLATQEKYKSGNEWKDRTDWHRVVIWGQLANVAENYLKKGSQVAIEGRLQTRSYETDGKTNYITEVVCLNLEMLDKKESGQESKKESKQEDEVPF